MADHINQTIDQQCVFLSLALEGQIIHNNSNCKYKNSTIYNGTTQRHYDLDEYVKPLYDTLPKHLLLCI